ncbi:MAG TPA: HTTM domain-containing protein [Gemmataceae bacterium]|nr:HTTM domain-containing protein [Gemmataceae bacterium]
MSNPIVLGLTPALPWPLRQWRWLITPVPAERATALRIAVGAVLLFDILVLYLPNLRTLYGAGGFGDPANFDAMFAPPFCRWSMLRWLPATWGPQFLIVNWLVAAVALLIGYRSRLAALVCWMAAVSFANSNHSLHNGGDQLKIVALLMLVFLPTDGCWSVRRHPLARGVGPVLVQAWPIRLLMVQLAVMYFMNGYYKSMGPAWRDGSVMAAIAQNPSWAHFSPDYLPLPDVALRFLAWTTVIWELLFPVLVLMPLTRAATIWIGVLFHVGTLIHLEVGLFPLYALCYYVPLLPWERRSFAANARL